MNLSNNLLKQANNYLENILSEAEKNAFELELSKNKELQEYLSITKEMDKQYCNTDWQFAKNTNTKEIEELEHYFKSDAVKDLKQVINKAKSSYSNNKKTTKHSKVKLYSFLAIAASVLLLIVFSLFNNNSNLYYNYNSWEELPSIIERGVLKNNLLHKAETAFVSKDYIKANKFYKQYLNETKNINPIIYLYTGITDLELNNETQALFYFNKVIESNSLDYSKGYWYKALTYLKTEQYNLAIKQLKIIVKDLNNYNYNEATILLNKLK